MKQLSARRPDVTLTRTTSGFGHLVDAITPWLLDLGSWIFGALIAFNLIILGALLTVGPVDVAVKVATVALALALPLDVAGFVLLRVVADLTKSNLSDLAATAFQEEGFTQTGARSKEAVQKRVRSATLIYSYGLLSAALLLTLTGVTAALWHMGWWIGAAFIAMVLVSQAVLVLAMAAFDSGGTWESPKS